MRWHLRIVAFSLAAFVLASCYERSETAIVNPDGSGKMLIVTDAAVPSTAGDAKPSSPVDYGKAFLRDLVNGSRGVDAWTDVAVAEAADHRAHTAIVAYFADISKVHLDLPVVFEYKKQDDGSYRFALARREPAGTGTIPATDDQLKTQIAQAKQRYQQQHDQIQQALAAFHLSISVTLPGAVSNVRIFTRDQNTLTIDFDGKKLAAGVDKYMADDDAIAASLKQGKPLMSDDDLVLFTLFGQKGPAEAIVKLPDQPLAAFNYKADVREAQLRQEAMFEAAGIELIPKLRITAPPTTTTTNTKP